MPFNLTTKRQLVWDDHGDYFFTAGASVTRVIAAPTKLGEAFPPSSWEQAPNVIGPYGSVAFDPVDGLYKMWYTVQQPDPPYRFVAYAEATDPVGPWAKPLLGLVDFGGTTNNNICYMAQDTDTAPIKYRDNLTFIDHRPGTPSAQRFKHLAWEFDVGVRVIVSEDGKTWSDPVTVQYAYNIDSFISGGWDSDEDAYVFYVRGWDQPDSPDKRVVMRVVVPAADLFGTWPAPAATWEKFGGGLPEIDGAAPNLELPTLNPNTDIYQAGFNLYDEAENMRVLIPTIYAQGTNRQNLHMAFSRDFGATWTWVDGTGTATPLIPRSPPGSALPDQAQLYFMGRLRKGDFDYLFYSASNTPHGDWQGNSRVLIARVGRERETGWHFPNSLEQMIISEITFTGKNLLVNVDIEAGGEFGAYLQRPDSTMVPLFGQAERIPQTIGGFDVQMRWFAGDDLTGVIGTPVKLIFIGKNATLYAFQFSDGAQSERCNALVESDYVMAPQSTQVFQMAGYQLIAQPTTPNMSGIADVVDWTADSFTLRSGRAHGFEVVRLVIDTNESCDLLFLVRPSQEDLGCLDS